MPQKSHTELAATFCSGLERLHAFESLPEDIALIREQNPLQRELHDGRPVVGWPKWAKDNLRSVIRYRMAITGADMSEWEPRMSSPNVLRQARAAQGVDDSTD